MPHHYLLTLDHSLLQDPSLITDFKCQNITLIVMVWVTMILFRVVLAPKDQNRCSEERINFAKYGT